MLLKTVTACLRLAKSSRVVITRACATTAAPNPDEYHHNFRVNIVYFLKNCFSQLNMCKIFIFIVAVKIKFFIKIEKKVDISI